MTNHCFRSDDFPITCVYLVRTARIHDSTKNMQTDRQLVTSAMRGDLTAFDALVQRYHSTVQGLAFHYVRNFQDAEDLAQETLIRAYRGLGQIRDPSQFKSWLAAITHNRCRSYLRGHRTDPSIDDADNATLQEFVATKTTPEKDLELKQLGTSISEAFDSLTEKERMVATLHYTSDLSYRDIGDFLNLPVSTVRGRLHKARKKLREGNLVPIAQQLGVIKKMPRLTIERNKGTVHFEGAIGWIRSSSDARTNDRNIRIPSQTVKRWYLVEGDVLEVVTRSPRSNENQRSVIDVERINNEPPSSDVFGAVRLQPDGSGNLITEEPAPEPVTLPATLAASLQIEHGDRVAGQVFNWGVRSHGKPREMTGIVTINDAPVARDVSHVYDHLPTPFTTDRGSHLIELALSESERLGASYIGTEHLLLGLLRQKESRAVQILMSLGVDSDALVDQIEAYSSDVTGASSRTIQFVPRARNVLKSAADEIARVDETSYGEHLLLALAKDEDGVAARMLMFVGVDYEDLKA